MITEEALRFVEDELENEDVLQADALAFRLKPFDSTH